MSEFLFGIISERTLRPQDLIPAFLEVLEQVAPKVHLQLTLDYEDWFFKYEKTDCDWEDEFFLDEAEFLLSDLFEELNEAAPENYYFGSAEDDGACFGFFRVEDSFD